MPLNIPSATSPNDLFTKLAGIDISVPGRIDGRNTEHTETWTIARLLSTLAESGNLDFPVSLTHRDRPDFLVKSGSAEVGVEVTEAISKQYAAYCALAEREFPDVFLEPSYFCWDAPSLTTEQMRELLRQSQMTADGWVGERPEQEWALFIQSVVDNKIAKLRHTDFAKYSENWLAIYDNLPLPNIHLTKAIGFLSPLLQERWPRKPCFDVIFVEHGPVIARITLHGTNCMVLNDLW